MAAPSLWLFLAVALVYLANGRPISSADTLPARYLPFSLLRAHTFDLGAFPFLYGEQALRTYAVLDGVPYFLRYQNGHYLSAYAPGSAILALPVYALPILLGVGPDSPWVPGLEKLSATLITALSVVFLYWALGALVSPGWALTIAAIYAFGTSSWSVSSQALWQHGPSQLFVALLLYCLTRGMTSERFLVYAGFAMTAAIVMRPTNLMLALPIAAWILYAHRRLILRFVLFALPPAAALLLYNLVYFGSAGGGAGPSVAPTWALFAQIPLREGLLGLLVSPSRGLFVYSPILVFSLFGFIWVWRRGPSPFKALTVGVALVLLVVSKWFLWWGGYTWGPRLLADTTPIFCFLLYPLTDAMSRHRLLKGAFVLFAALSIGTHALGAFAYDGHWDSVANVGRDDSPLWSWKDGPLVFYGREAASVIGKLMPRRVTSGPTSADSPALLAASYAAEPIASEAVTEEALPASVTATNTGRAVWLATAPGYRGAVRLGWRWAPGDLVALEGRADLSSDVIPGQAAHFAARIRCPAAPGDYTLTIDLVSELVTWFADQRQAPIRVSVKVLPRDSARLLSDAIATDAWSPAVTISTDRASYRRTDTLHLTVELANPHRPLRFDAYLVLQAPDRTVWFYDGKRPPSPSWVAWVREIALPARAIGHFSLPLSPLADGAYRWHVVLTEPGASRGLARAAASFTIAP